MSRLQLDRVGPTDRPPGCFNWPSTLGPGPRSPSRGVRLSAWRNMSVARLNSPTPAVTVLVTDNLAKRPLSRPGEPASAAVSRTTKDQLRDEGVKLPP